jgi:DNA polymerase-3 subunit gamma/tau
VAYQVFARKWRPKSFSSLKGQEHVTRALINAITRNELHHAYLFTGTRGVGKTTIARILAKCLNCEQGVTAQPCGECSACRDIDAGRFVDLIEVDAASRTKVEDTRELLDNVQYAPTSGRYKIYLIDEVHMLSGHSFNALLKTLEEPPPHVKFILATTDPERIPVTVLSRCLRFVLRALSVTEIVIQLEEILTSENIPYEKRALHVIARAASGSMRDALSLLEQANAYCDGSIKTEPVEEILGISYQRFMGDLLQAMANNDVKQCLHLVEQMASIGADFTQVLATILQILHAIAIAQAVPQSEGIASFADINPELLAIKELLSPEIVQLFYQIALMGQKELSNAPSARIGFEMTLLRMLVFRPKETSVQPIPLSKIAPTPTSHSASPVEVKKENTDIQSKLTPTATVPSAPTAAVPSAPTAAVPSAPTAPTAVPSEGSLNWVEVVSKLPLSALALSLVKNCVVSTWDGKALSLTLDPLQKTCLNPQRQTQIQDALIQYFGYPIKLIIEVGDVQSGTPLMIAQAQEQLRTTQAKTAIEQDKTVQNILSTFDATVEKITAVDQ